MIEEGEKVEQRLLVGDAQRGERQTAKGILIAAAGEEVDGGNVNCGSIGNNLPTTNDGGAVFEYPHNEAAESS